MSKDPENRREIIFLETLIYNGRQSICFRSGNIFRKYFKYAGLDTAEREAQQSLLFEKLGILTPHFIATGYSESNGFFYNEYFYLEMTALTEEILTDYLLDEIASTVGKISASGFSTLLHSLVTPVLWVTASSC